MFGLISTFYRFLFRPLLALICMPLLPFSKLLRELLQGWQQWPAELTALSYKEDCMNTPVRIWIHSPSVGEFESVRWLIDQLLKHESKSIVVTYASPSMKSYLEANSELAKHPRFCKLFFPLDSFHRLMKFRRVYRPSHFVLLQYDFFPNLMQVIMEDDPIQFRTLLNFTPPTLTEELASQILKDFYDSYLQMILHHRFTLIHRCVETASLPFAFPDLGLTFTAPHTRWANLPIHPSKELARIFQVVCGNVHPSDIQFLKAVFGFVAPLDYQLIWVPHNTQPHILATILKQLRTLCQKYSISFRTASDLKSIEQDSQPGIVLFTKFGVLKQLYQQAHFAYVGGGYTSKGIHNLIEPLSWGCPVISGPQYKRQSVALWAKEKGFLKVCEGSISSIHGVLAEMFSHKEKYLELQQRIIDARNQMRHGSLEIPRYLTEFVDVE